MMHKHQPLSKFIKLVPENLEFPDPESTKDLTIESNAPWTLGVKTTTKHLTKANLLIS